MLTTHHLDDSSKPHCCAICGKGFTRSDLLKRHESGHERWDADGKGPGTAKRRKVAFKGSESSSLCQVPPLWQPADAGSSIPSYTLNGSTTFPQSFVQNEPGRSSHYTIDGALHNPISPMHKSVTHDENSVPDYQGHTFHPHQLSNDEVARFHLNPMDDIPFDFSSFLIPPEDIGPTGNEWFSYDFYSAMRETGHDWGNLGAGYDMSTPGQDYGDSMELAPHNETTFEDPNHQGDSHRHEDSHHEGDPHQQEDSHHKRGSQNHPNGEDHHGSITRISSPPNEASEEDKWPFQWNPNSRPILKAHAITIPQNHPLLLKHSPRFDITEATLLRLKSFLHPPSGREFHQSQKGTFILPPLSIINVFIHLFFDKFSPQMPVLHHATVNTNSDLPPPLLAAIIIIGALYSHIKHTRRFAIVLLDLVRWHLRIALECDNSLMREPYIIYAEALICHTGLWCGNKRAFELAEVVRGALVTYIRRVGFGDQFSQKPVEETGKETNSLQAEWKKWIAEESQRRLAWVIYSTDSQFPSILNLPPSISIGEVRNLGCPCDEEFWCATSARNWKNLLGPASVPPSRSFSAAVGPFLLATGRTSGRLPMLSLNPWSAFLVLISITHQIFHASQETMIAQTFDHNDDDDDVLPVDETIKVLRQLKLIRQDQLASWFSPFIHVSVERTLIYCRCTRFLVVNLPPPSHTFTSFLSALLRLFYSLTRSQLYSSLYPA